MGEIKSTLDLVMERTRHLTLSRDEKSAQEAQEHAQRIRGLVQRYQDQTLTLRELERDLGRDFPAELGKPGGILHRELLQRIVPGQDNGPILMLIKTLCRADPDSLVELLEDVDRSLEALRSKHSANQLAILAGTFGIQGSAVRPNLARDPEWQAARETLMADFASRIARTAVPDQE